MNKPAQTEAVAELLKRMNRRNKSASAASIAAQEQKRNKEFPIVVYVPRSKIKLHLSLKNSIALREVLLEAELTYLNRRNHV